MRGRTSGLLPLELAILQMGLALASEEVADFHGFLMMTRLREQGPQGLFQTHGAMYKALDRLERRGLLSSQWEDPALALSEGRPRRRLYRVTHAGQSELVESARRGSIPALPATQP